MEHINSQIVYFLATILFISIVLLNRTKKNAAAVWLYVIQSGAIASLLFIGSIEKTDMLGITALIATILVKIFIAPAFFFRLIKKHQFKFSASTYVNTPLTFVIIAILAAFAKNYFESNFIFVPESQNLIFISTASILTSLFLLVNRKGALSQMLAILSLENSIVAFAIFAGLEQNPGLQLGIIFDILIWVIIASVFAGMMHRHFGSLDDVTKMKKLTE